MKPILNVIAFIVFYLLDFTAMVFMTPKISSTVIITLLFTVWIIVASYNWFVKVEE